MRWRQVSEFAVLVELRLFDDFLTPLLVDRVAFGNRERLGMVTLRVEGIQEVASVNLAEITGKQLRSEERRVGKECRSRWSPYH